MKIVDELEASYFQYSEEDLDSVRKIVSDVRKEGHRAVERYSLEFDKAMPHEIKRQDIESAYDDVDADVIGAIRKAAQNIKNFAKAQMSQIKDLKFEKEGVTLGHRVIPIDKAGCYVPGGRYPLPSSALMSVIPAKVAGVRQVVVVSPKIRPETIVAADIAGADRIFSAGGAQAIAALAYGTEMFPKVDKIVGPGNRYVTYAKKLVFGAVGIDFIAGPSEVLIIADDSARADLVAADLLAQAEHDPDARCFLLTTDRDLAEDVNKEICSQIDLLATKETAEKSLEKGRIVIVKSVNDAIGISNRLAPEHLELCVKDPESIKDDLRNYGSLFIASAEVFGDYCSGTNHILPTSGAARYSAGLSVRDFVKLATFQKISKDALPGMIDIASALAEVEGLDAHKKSAILRYQ